MTKNPSAVADTKSKLKSDKMLLTIYLKSLIEHPEKDATVRLRLNTSGLLVVTVLQKDEPARRTVHNWNEMRDGYVIQNRALGLSSTFIRASGGALSYNAGQFTSLQKLSLDLRASMKETPAEFKKHYKIAPTSTSVSRPTVSGWL